MAGDWLTEGLQATGLVPVVPWPTALQASQLLQTQREAGRSVNPVSFLREETGAGTVVTGSYYLLGDSLQFRLEVADAVRGRVLGTIAPIIDQPHVRAPGRNRRRCANRLMGMIALWTEDEITHARQLEQRPAHLRGLSDLRGRSRAIPEPGLRGCHDRVPPCLPGRYRIRRRAAQCRHREAGTWAMRELTDSIVREIHLREAKLGDFQRSRLESLDALVAGDGEAEVIALRKASAEAPASMATYNLAVASLSTDRPRGGARGRWRALEPERGRHARLVIVLDSAHSTPCISSEITSASWRLRGSSSTGIRTGA